MKLPSYLLFLGFFITLVSSVDLDTFYDPIIPVVYVCPENQNWDPIEKKCFVQCADGYVDFYDKCTMICPQHLEYDSQGVTCYKKHPLKIMPGSKCPDAFILDPTRPNWCWIKCPYPYTE